MAQMKGKVERGTGRAYKVPTPKVPTCCQQRHECATATSDTRAPEHRRTEPDERDAKSVWRLDAAPPHHSHTHTHGTSGGPCCCGQPEPEQGRRALASDVAAGGGGWLDNEWLGPMMRPTRVRFP